MLGTFHVGKYWYTSFTYHCVQCFIPKKIKCTIMKEDIHCIVLHKREWLVVHFKLHYVLIFVLQILYTTGCACSLLTICSATQKKSHILRFIGTKKKSNIFLSIGCIYTKYFFIYDMYFPSDIDFCSGVTKKYSYLVYPNPKMKDA